MRREADGSLSVTLCVCGRLAVARSAIRFDQPFDFSAREARVSLSGFHDEGSEFIARAVEQAHVGQAEVLDGIGVRPESLVARDIETGAAPEEVRPALNSAECEAGGMLAYRRRVP